MPPSVLGLPHPIGWVDGLTEDHGERVLWGWAVPPEGDAYDRLNLHWNGEERGPAEPRLREDLVEAVPWVGHAPRGGFVVRVTPQDGGRLDVVCQRRGRPVAVLSTTYLAPGHDGLPLPPAVLSTRVSGFAGEVFRLSGLKASTDLWDAVARHSPAVDRLRVLDWGCGCGRVARYLTRMPSVELAGCDIDADAVAWCDANLPGSFTATAPEPPLPYSDGEMHVVVASSVFTHLPRRYQGLWLQEMRRILVPGGLLLASVAGQTAYLQSRPRPPRSGPPGSVVRRAAAWRSRKVLRRAGILDGRRDDWLDGIAPPDYYRLVHQSREYTTRTWAETGLQVVDYIERGYHGHQDLVVLRAPA